MMDKDIGTRIRYFREYRGMSAADLADKIGVSRELIQKWETGQRRIYAEYIPGICKALRADISLILGSYIPPNDHPDFELDLLKEEIESLSKHLRKINEMIGEIRNG